MLTQNSVGASDGSMQGRPPTLAPLFAVALAAFWLFGFCRESIAADKSGVSPNSISVPSGPGSIEGMGESFQPTLNTGTTKYGYAFRLPAGPAGLEPSLALAYEGGDGNGPIGFGWSLPLPWVQRRTEKGVPLYDGALAGALGRSDTFINQDREELVPVGEGRFFCKNESSFVRYRWMGSNWVADVPDGRRLMFGASDQTRVVNAQESEQVFSWLLEREEDVHGNVVTYQYTNFPTAQDLNQKYISEIRYGAGKPPWGAFFFVRFEYEPREDWFEDGRPGFLVRTGHRLRSVMVGAQGAELPDGHARGDWNGDGIGDQLVRRYDLGYLAYSPTTSHWSLLHQVKLIGADGTNSLPPLTLGYRVCEPPAVTNALGRILLSIDAPASVMDAEDSEFADLNGDGLPDILRTGAGAGADFPHEAWINQGPVEGGIGWRKAPMGGDPRAFGLGLQTNVVHLADMDGDGLADLVLKHPGGEVSYHRNSGRLAWEDRQAIDASDTPPPAPYGEANVRVADVDFDKRSDIIRSIGLGDGYQFWLNLGDRRFSARTAGKSGDAVAYTFDEAGTEITDLNGDRVPDIARIRPTGIEFAAGVGYGRFLPAEFIRIENPPEDELRLLGAKFTDLTGDGLSDLVLEQAAPGELWYWINLGNRRFSPRHSVTGLPVGLASTGVRRWADINGNGTTDLVYADSTHPARLLAVDLGELIGCLPGGQLLSHIDNGIGRVVRIEYTPSTTFALQDAAAGNAWPDPIPFPVQVVSAVVVEDSMGHAYRAEFRYHDGYYDAGERQFRGFGRVEQLDLGDPTAPTLVTRSHFDTGRDFEVMKGKLLRLTVQQEDLSIFSDQTTAWTVPPVTLYPGTNGTNVVFAHPKGSVTVLKELGRGSEKRLETESTYDRYGNQTLDANYGIVEDGNRSASDDERIVTTEFAVNEDAWLIRHPKRTQVADEQGALVSRTEFFYDDETFGGGNLGQVVRGNLTMKREWWDPAMPDAYVKSTRTKYDGFGNPILLLDPLAAAPKGAVDLSQGHVRELAYDQRFKTHPTGETIHLGEGKPPLEFGATYDLGLGVVTSTTDFNGNRTSFGYDGFGRLTSIVRPYDTTNYPTAEYTYALAVPYRGSNLVNYVETRQLDKKPGTAGDSRAHYLISREFVDGLGRKLMSKHEAGPIEDGGRPRVSVKGAVTFNQRMKPARAINPFYSTMAGAPDDQLAYESIEDPAWSGEFQLGEKLVSLDLSAAHATSSEYDATLREVKTVNPDGTSRRTVYEPLLTRSYDENDNDPSSPYHDTPMVHANDGLGRLVEVQETAHLDDEGRPTADVRVWTTRYVYDLNDQLTQITDSQGNVKTFAYDGLKRKTGMDDPDRGVMSFQYDDASNLTGTRDAKDQRITYTYDGANRIRTEDYQDEGLPFSGNLAYHSELPISSSNRADVVYFYDTPQANLDVGDGSVATAANVRGKLAYVWDLAGEEHTSYDARDRAAWVVKRVRDPIHTQLVSFRTGFAYDSLDRITYLTYPDNDAIGYEYDDRYLLARIRGGQAGVLTKEGYVVSGIRYGPSDQQLQIRYGNGIQTAYSYDARLRLDRLNTSRETDTQNPLIDFGYQFDGVSNLRRIDDGRPGAVAAEGDARRNTQIFGYDDLYRLTGVQYSFALPGKADRDDGRIAYRYDRIGNMLAQDSTLSHVEKGLPVANLGDMESGGAAGRWNRRGRTATDPPGPHALSSVRNPAFPSRDYPYDPNGNMTNLDGMVATWDFKDRLVRLEDTKMMANYAYDFTDRRITKKVLWKHGEPTSSANQPSTLVSKPSTTTVTYVGKHFEVRENEAPTKYVFNGNARVARVTGTLMPANLRVQRLRVSAGWNLSSLAVSATNAVQQLSSLSASGGEGQDEVVQSVFKWRTDTRVFAVVSASETLPAGTVLWIKAATNATLRVLGRYEGLPPGLRAPPEGDFLPGSGLEAWNLTSTLIPQSLTTLWALSPERQNWQTQFAPPLTPFSDFPPVLAVGQAFYGSAPAPVELEQPPCALSLRYYHQDHLGSSSVLSDATGQVVQESANYPFGATRNQTRPRGVGEAYQFTQKERDAESSLDYFEARFLAGSMARFLRFDPVCAEARSSLLRVPQANNPYNYALNNPLRYNDPTGKFAEKLFQDIGDFGKAIRDTIPSLVGVPLGRAIETVAGVGQTIAGILSFTKAQIETGISAIGHGILGIFGFQEALTEPWKMQRGMTGSLRMPESLGSVVRNANMPAGSPEHAKDAANGMHGWHASSNAGLASKLGPFMAPFQWLAGIAHETIDFPSIRAEVRAQGPLNGMLDAIGDIAANTVGMVTGLLVPPRLAPSLGRAAGNFVPGPGDPDPRGLGGGGYTGDPRPAWSGGN